MWFSDLNVVSPGNVICGMRRQPGTVSGRFGSFSNQYFSILCSKFLL